MTWKFVFLELANPGEATVVLSRGGFPTRDDALAEGSAEAERIASLRVHSLKNKVFRVDAHEETDGEEASSRHASEAP
jgi:hypothetical protein